ncbi:MAG: hypothetical protein JWQ09_5748 [Segetibacter sp.]|nr:hypothetical protein [Segetibacter sp.]
MAGQKNIATVSMLLSMTAGYVDTTTFIAADNLFSAHVTGNFVVFVYNIVEHADMHSWLKLLSFPFFIVAVIVGNKIILSSSSIYKVIKLQGVLLVVAGLISLGFKRSSEENNIATFLLSMLVVFAMGLQNAFGKLHPKVTYAPTTVMTGNVTQITIDVANYLREGKHTLETSTSLRNQGIVIGVFFIGCLLGGIISSRVGLAAITLPGLALLYYFRNTK